MESSHLENILFTTARGGFGKMRSCRSMGRNSLPHDKERSKAMAMAMAHQWLDDIFAAGQGDYGTSWNVLIHNKRFCAAVQQAAAAYSEAVAQQKMNQAQGLHVYGGTPEQYARTTFLHEMNQDDLDRSGYGAAAPAAP